MTEADPGLDEELDSAEAAARLVDRCFAEAGMTSAADKPLAVAMKLVLAAALENRRSVDAVSKRTASRAAAAASAVMERSLLRLSVRLSRLQWTGLALAGLVLWGVGYGMGRQADVMTPLGPMSPRVAEILRFNDIGQVVEGCREMAPINRRRRCGAGLWLEPAPAAPPS